LQRTRLLFLTQTSYNKRQKIPQILGISIFKIK